MFVYPVELIDWQVEKQGERSRLYWSTSSETNTEAFILERSLDGRNFEEIGRVGAAGFSQERIDYEFWDSAPYRGKNYYRLKTLDLNGALEHSEIRLIEFDEGRSKLNCLSKPNQQWKYFLC